MALPATYVEGFHNVEAVKKMKYVPFGNTGLKVSVLGFGGGAFGNHYGDYDLQDAVATLKEAIQNGVNYIDTAPFYGEGRSENTLGKALKEIPRSAYYIATKVARYSLETERAFDFSYDNTIKSVDESLKKLGIDYIDLIQVHDVEFAPNTDIIVKETLPALAEVVKQGKARFIGVTGYPVSKLKEVIDASNTKIDAVLSYCRLTLMDNTLQDYIPDFQAKGLAVIHAGPPALGLLCNRGPWDWHPGNPLYKEKCAVVAKFCQDQGVELGRLAMYWTMQQAGVATHLVGMQNRDLVRSNIDITVNGLSDKEKQVLDTVLSKYLNPSDKLHWEEIEIKNYWKEMKKLGKA